MIKKIKKLIKPLVYDIVHMGGKFKCTVCGRRSKYFREAGGFSGVTSRLKLI